MSQKIYLIKGEVVFCFLIISGNYKLMVFHLALKKTIKSLLLKYGVYPSKRLGQNFLIDEVVLKKIIKAADLTKKDVVLEIGPGIGNLTKELASKAKKVVAIEKDPKMIEILKETLKNFKNVEIIQGDILKLNSKVKGQKSKLKRQNYKVVANIPYYLTSALIRKFLEAKIKPKLMVLMVQKEVAQRIAARPPKMNLLAVSVQFYSKPKIISYVSKKAFWPKPKVDSAILKILPLTNTDKKLINTDLFFRIVKAGFSHPRKQILNNFSKMLKLDKEKVKTWLKDNKIQPQKRAESLSLQDWKNLVKSFSSLK